ncbi:MAG: aldehyde ferredoxin oxidoreductase family protein [Bacillota bacterium]
MSTLFGFTGKILFVDLSSGSLVDQHLPDSFYENFLSGSGLGIAYLYTHIPQGADPLGPDNILGFVSGLLTGTGSVLTGRWMAVCKSPLTGGWGDANCGGNLSPAIKQCGYDGIFFKGISDKPVYLIIDEQGPRLEDASFLWGTDTTETEKLLENEYRSKKKPSIAVIGAAAENLSLISGICNDYGRIAARSGCGAVMGSKKLKAVVLSGSNPVKSDRKDEVRRLTKNYTNKVKKIKLPGFFKGSILPLAGKMVGKMKTMTALDGMTTIVPSFKKWGTPVSNSLGVTSGDLPIKNWGGSVLNFNYSHYKHLNPDLIISREQKKYSCYSCTIGCGGICKIDDISEGEYKETHKPEYETCAAFGGLLVNKNRDSIFYINEILNRAGMDSISAGNTVAFAIECYENGLLDQKDTGGLELTWGNAPAIIALVKKMIAREGLGDVLADGVKQAVAKIGKDSSTYAMHAGGQEPGLHDPRFDPLLGVHFSSDPTPGRHTISSAQYYLMMHLWEKVSWAPRVTRYPKAEEYIPSENEALKAVAGASFKQVLDGSGGCLFAAISGLQHWPLFEWLNAVTGWDKSADEYMEIGRRMQTLRQMFNIREGINPLDFKMPDRLAGNPPLEEGPLKDKMVPIEEMIKLYWKYFGWDEKNGAPLEDTISKLGLDRVKELLPEEEFGYG